MIVEIKLMMQVRFYEKGDIVYQHVIHNNKRGSKYLFDERYDFSQLFKRKLETMLLSKYDNYIFLSKEIKKDREIYEFRRTDNTPLSKQDFNFTMAGFVPRHPGCDECKFNLEEKEKHVNCDKKDKWISVKIKNCKFFRQKGSLFKK